MLNQNYDLILDIDSWASFNEQLQNLNIPAAGSDEEWRCPMLEWTRRKKKDKFLGYEGKASVTRTAPTSPQVSTDRATAVQQEKKNRKATVTFLCWIPDQGWQGHLQDK